MAVSNASNWPSPGMPWKRLNAAVSCSGLIGSFAGSISTYCRSVDEAGILELRADAGVDGWFRSGQFACDRHVTSKQSSRKYWRVLVVAGWDGGSWLAGAAFGVLAVVSVSASGHWAIGAGGRGWMRSVLLSSTR